MFASFNSFNLKQGKANGVPMLETCADMYSHSLSLLSGKGTEEKLTIWSMLFSDRSFAAYKSNSNAEFSSYRVVNTVSLQNNAPLTIQL